MHDGRFILLGKFEYPWEETYRNVVLAAFLIYFNINVLDNNLKYGVEDIAQIYTYIW